MSASPITAHIAIQGANKIFASADREVVALKDIQLDIPQGQFVCLLGPSGCGKSTLLNAIADFSLPTSGSITAGDKEVPGPGPVRGMVFQEYALFPWMTVKKNIAFGLEIKGMAAATINATVATLLAKLGLTDFRSRYPKDLSGGMRQRVAIARILALYSPIMLMDEPFGALGALTRRNLQDALPRLRDPSSPAFNTPAFAVGWNGFLGAVRNALSLDAALRELAICAVLQFTLEMTRKVQVSHACFQRVQQALGSTQAQVELVGVIAAYNMVSRFLEALLVAPEAT